MAESPFQVLSIHDLLLWDRNPRLTEEATSQSEIINQMVNSDGKNLYELAKDIVDHGKLNPAENIIVLQRDGTNTVYEGNRRICALKILDTPEIVDNESFQKRVAKLAGRKTFPVDANCYVVDDPEEQYHFIRLKHTGQNEGAGVVDWSTWEKEHFLFEFFGEPKSQAMIFVESIEAMYAGDNELVESINNVKRHRYTSVDRLVSNAGFRDAFGISFKGQEMLIAPSKTALKPGIKKFFGDLEGERGKVSEFYNSDKIEDYIQEIKSALPSRTELKKQPKVVAVESPTKKVAPKPQKPSKPKKPVIRLFAGLELPNQPERTQSILYELQSTKVYDFENGCAVLLRVLVEAVVAETIQRSGWKPDSDVGLRDRVLLCANKIDPKKELQELKFVRQKANTKFDPASINTLHNYVHNRHFNPIADNLKKVSDNYAPYLKVLDEHCAKN